MMTPRKLTLLDAGVLIAALLQGDARHAESRSVVEAARRGELAACVTTSILSEVYAALTWIGAQPPHSPAEAARAVCLLIEPPSALVVLSDGLEAALKMLELAEYCHLTARRVHDARHAATAWTAGVVDVYTYDIEDWQLFAAYGLRIAGPASTLARLKTGNR
jgi:predicted nucleic acid-binding protein